MNGAFSGRQRDALQAAVRNLARIHFNRARKQVEPGTLRQLFVPAEHREIVRKAYELAAPPGTVFELWYAHDTPFARGGNPVPFRFTWHAGRCPDGFLIPRSMRGTALKQLTAEHIQPDAPAELKETFLATFMTLCDLSWRWGMVMYVLDHLAAANRTVAQVRFVWPTILPLLRCAGCTDLAADNEQVSTRAGDKACVPQEIVHYIKPAGDMVARSFLIEKGPVPNYPVQYDMQTTCFNDFDGVVW
jgi:hypothetical protein